MSFAGKPIIGLAGGIGSGKSFIAGLFGEMGCCVIDSDAQVKALYDEAAVRQKLRAWWGEQAFTATGEVDRAVVGRLVFADPQQRLRLEGLLHPLVNARRLQAMQLRGNDPSVKAFVWDTPLLFETGLNKECDVMVFVDASLEIRLERVRKRGWAAQELARRENLQLPLDKKHEISDYTIRNTADATCARSQVKEILSRILCGLPGCPQGN